MVLAQLREQVNDRTAPYRMDVETLEAHAQWARPLTPGNARNLARLGFDVGQSAAIMTLLWS